MSSRFKSEIPAPCVPAELAAAGWEAYTASDGRPYFVDHNTGQTRWDLLGPFWCGEDPAAAAARQGGQLGAVVLDAHAAEAAAAALAARDAEEADAALDARIAEAVKAALAARDADEENRAQLKATKVAAKNAAKKARRAA